VRVRVNEARRQDAPARVEDFARRIYERLDLFARADLFDQPAAHEHRAALDDCKLAHLTSNPRPSRPRERDELRAVDDGERLLQVSL
jgi:hypothetical protein